MASDACGELRRASNMQYHFVEILRIYRYALFSHQNFIEILINPDQYTDSVVKASFCPKGFKCEI